MVRYRDLKKIKKKKNSQEKRCGPVVTTNLTVLWICICFILELATLGMNRWFIRQDPEIKFWHGGLWNQCQGEIDRTFCSYIRETPGKYLETCVNTCLYKYNSSMLTANLSRSDS